MATAVAEPDVLNNETDHDESNTEDGAVSQIVSFRLANEEYGVDIMRVQEIILVGQITKMPEVPDYICGLINLRGHVIPIVDLRKRFGLPAQDETEHTRIIVLNVNNKTIGIVVDAVNEVLRINADQIEPPPSSVAGIEHEYLTGLVKFEEHLLVLLNVDAVMKEDVRAKLDQAQRAASAPAS
ncbi:MAG: chemotaxis protein CheW [Phycisphaerae bacterium]